MPRRKFQVTETQRQRIRTLAGFHLPLKDIASIVGIGSVDALRKHFHHELALGALEARARVKQTLFRLATSGKNVAATIYCCKTRLGWRERGPVEERQGSSGVIWDIHEYQPPRSPEQQKRMDELLAKAEPIPPESARWEGDQGYYEGEDEEVPRRRRLQ